MLRCFAFKRNTMSSTGEIDAQRVVDLLPYTNLRLVQNCTDNLVEPDLCQKTYLAVICVYDAVAEQYE